MKCLSGIRWAAQIRERASPQAVALTGQRNGACRAQDGTLPHTAVLVSSVGFSGLMLMNINVTSLDRSKWPLEMPHWVLLSLCKEEALTQPVCFFIFVFYCTWNVLFLFEQLSILWSFFVCVFGQNADSIYSIPCSGPCKSLWLSVIL